MKTSGKFDQDEDDLKKLRGLFKFRLKDTARKSFLDFVPVSIKINRKISEILVFEEEEIEESKSNFEDDEEVFKRQIKRGTCPSKFQETLGKYAESSLIRNHRNIGSIVNIDPFKHLTNYISKEKYKN